MNFRIVPTFLSVPRAPPAMKWSQRKEPSAFWHKEALGAFHFVSAIVISTPPERDFFPLWNRILTIFLTSPMRQRKED